MKCTWFCSQKPVRLSSVRLRGYAWVCIWLGVCLSRCLGAVWADWGLAGKSPCGMFVMEYS